MKRLLLFSLAIGITLGAVAQNKLATRNNNLLMRKANVTTVDNVVVPFIPMMKPHGAHTKDVTSVMIGTSGNIFGLIVASENWLDYDPGTNAVMFTHRALGAWGGNTGDLRCKFSTDWFSSIHDSVVFLRTATEAYRYPSGVIYNPAGNTDVNNAFAVVAGPLLTAAFSHNFYCSQRLDETLLDTNYIPLVAPVASLERTNLSGGGGYLHNMSQVDDGASYLPIAQIRNGIFNSTTNAFDWSLVQTQVTRLFGKRIFSDGPYDADFAWNHAWATNGLDGYAFCTGIDSTMKVYSGTQVPLIWRTWDGGLTFSPIAPYGCFDFLTNLTDSIWPTALSAAEYNAGTGPLVFRPVFNAGSSVDDNVLPGVVDYNGDLHMAAIIEGAFSYNVDSLDYTFLNHPQYLFDVIYDKSADKWDVRFIDQIFSLNVADANGAAVISSSGNMGWEHWINVSKSPDGKCVFYTWTDTDPSMSTDNIVPDIKGRAWNVETNMATPAKNFTAPNGGLYYYVNTADIVAKQGSTYAVALTFVDIAGDAGNNGDGPQIHYFANNITFAESEFTDTYGPSDPLVLNTCLVGVDTKEVNSFNVSQNFPNPSNGTTSVKVTLAEASNVSVEITNMVGQSVSLVNNGRLVAGSHNINLNVANLNSGIYFYTVTVGTQKVTKKMIVK